MSLFDLRINLNDMGGRLDNRMSDNLPLRGTYENLSFNQT